MLSERPSNLLARKCSQILCKDLRALTRPELDRLISQSPSEIADFPAIRWLMCCPSRSAKLPCGPNVVLNSTTAA